MFVACYLFYFSFFQLAKNSELDQFFGAPIPVSTLMLSSWQMSHSGMVSGEQRSPPLVKTWGFNCRRASRTVWSCSISKGITKSTPRI